LRADNPGNQQRDRDQDADDGEEEEDGNVILRHESSKNRDQGENEILTPKWSGFKDG
jgi:hypothetical protein